jgi:hypothetical protein
MGMESRLELPDVVPVDPSKGNEAVWVSLDDTLFVPAGVADSFKQVDNAYTTDRLARLNFMADAVSQYTHRNMLDMPSRIDVSLVRDARNDKSDELLVITSPLNDGRPKSSPRDLNEFITNPNPTRRDVKNAQPNSWSPATKLDIAYEFLNVEGVNMPVLQIFNRVPPLTMSLRERAKLLAKADFEGFGRVALEGIEFFDFIRSGYYGSPKIKKVHFFGAGMAHNTAAAAHYLQTRQDKYAVGSLTMMNLVMGERLAKMLPDYSVRQHAGEAAKVILPPGYTRIEEPIMRQEIDRKGTEFAMRKRQVRALADLSYMQGIARSSNTQRKIEELIQDGTVVTVGNAYNGTMTAATNERLPVGEKGLHLTDIVGVEGKKVGMMSNEHSALVALMIAIGIKNARSATEI